MPSDLRVQLESHLPRSLAVGRAIVLFCYGHCFHRTEEVDSLELLVAGDRHRPTAAAMPRRDLYEWLHGPHGGGADPLGHSYRSGFWATLAIPAASHPGSLIVQAAVRTRNGARWLAPLGRIEIVSPPMQTALAPRLPAGTIAVCMATFEPDPVLLRQQVESLRAQTDERWVCVLSDGGSSPGSWAQIQEIICGDRRFTLSRSSERLDPYRNFERAFTMAPAEAELLAPCDQDDLWYPDKLAVLREALGSRALAYCDQRLVTDDGTVLRESLWQGRRNDCENLASLLVANTVPGAAMLLRREVAARALPFPDAPGTPYHDHWLALAALASGDVAYVDRPLYDYVQHVGAVSGDVSAPADGAGPVQPRARWSLGASRGWRAAYFSGYLSRAVLAGTLLLRCADVLSPRKRRALAWFVAAERSPLAFAWLAVRPARRVIGRDETLGGELALVAGVAWRRLLAVAVAGSQTPGRRAFDASFPYPARFEQRRLRRWRAAR